MGACMMSDIQRLINRSDSSTLWSLLTFGKECESNLQTSKVIQTNCKSEKKTFHLPILHRGGIIC